jgi:hypothetical protein
VNRTDSASQKRECKTELVCEGSRMSFYVVDWNVIVLHRQPLASYALGLQPWKGISGIVGRDT